MNVPNADASNAALSSLERSQFALHERAHTVRRVETDEPLVRQAELETRGLMVQPFWQTPNDLEGDAYQTYIATHADFELMVRSSVADRLANAQLQLPEGLQLVLRAGFRPYDVQIDLLQRFTKKSQHDHPAWTNEQHLAHARTFVSDPSIVCPPHVTGGAVDVELFDVTTGRLVDVGGVINDDSEVSFLFYDALSLTQRDNRLVLLKAMLSAGFAPNPYEWWHYQYGETYWAAFYGHKTTLYDIIKP